MRYEYEFISSEWNKLFQSHSMAISVSTRGTTEALIILDELPIDAMEVAQAAITKVMTENKRVCITFSGGKDSHTCLLLVIRFKLENPDCQTEVIVVSSDTGVENPVLKQHILRVKERVESLLLSIPFFIVQPEAKDTYYTCVIGKGVP